MLLDERLISAGEALPIAPSARGNPSVVKRNAAHFFLASLVDEGGEAQRSTSRAEREGREVTVSSANRRSQRRGSTAAMCRLS